MKHIVSLIVLFFSLISGIFAQRKSGPVDYQKDSFSSLQDTTKIQYIGFGLSFDAGAILLPPRLGLVEDANLVGISFLFRLPFSDGFDDRYMAKIGMSLSVETTIMTVECMFRRGTPFFWAIGLAVVKPFDDIWHLSGSGYRTLANYYVTRNVFQMLNLSGAIGYSFDDIEFEITSRVPVDNNIYVFVDEWLYGKWRNILLSFTMSILM